MILQSDGGEPDKSTRNLFFGFIAVVVILLVAMLYRLYRWYIRKNRIEAIHEQKELLHADDSFFKYEIRKTHVKSIVRMYPQ